MIRSLLFLLLAFAAGSLLAQQPAPLEVDTAAVLRRGDMVTVMGEGPRSGPDEMFIAAVAPPEDDSDQWYVTLFVDEKLPSTQLKAAFQKEPALNCFVAAPAGNRPWAHFNVFNGGDRTQKWRIERYKIGSYPTIVIQPPRNGDFGPPDNVVVHIAGFDGDTAALAKKIQEGVRFYTAKMVEQGKAVPKRATSAWTLGGNRGWGQQVIGQQPPGVDPPFDTPPRADNQTPVYVPFPPAPAQPQQPAQGQPGSDLAVTLLVNVIAWLFQTFPTATVVIASILLSVFAWIRTSRTAAGQGVLLTDEQFKKLSDALSNQTPPKPAA